jgi:hypothetical protein
MQIASPVTICSRRSPATTAGATPLPVTADTAEQRRSDQGCATPHAQTLLFAPRRVGKSALAQRLVAELGASGCYLDAARPADYDRLRAGASDLWPAGCKLTVIDEVHRVPQALPGLLRRNIDRPLRAGDRGGCFLHGGVGSRDQTTSNRPLSVARGFRAGGEVLRPGRRYFVHGGEETGETPRGVTVIGLQALAEQLFRDATTTVTVTGLRARAERFAQRQVS